MLPDFILFLFTYLGPNPAAGFVRMDLDSHGADWVDGTLDDCKFLLWRSDYRPEPKFLFYSPVYLLLIHENYPTKRYCLWVSCTPTLVPFRHRVLGMLSDIVKMFLLCHVPKTHDYSDYCVVFLHSMPSYLKRRRLSPVFSIIVVFLLTQILKSRATVGTLFRSLLKMLVDLFFNFWTQSTYFLFYFAMWYFLNSLLLLKAFNMMILCDIDQ